MDERQGIMEASKVDFLFRPLLSGSLHKPVVVFTDGFQFHKDSVSEDTLKRQALSRTRRYRVWTLSWRDVQMCFARKVIIVQMCCHQQKCHQA